MATTTTNFGWDIPQSTDLVKDGATAIAALGQDIDTAFIDLKGGTTGQVLAKASGTDLDFSWVAQDDSNAIQNAIVDAKGDLISATANDTPARLAVGTNNHVLTADSTTATGLKWAAVSADSMTLLANGNLTGTSVSLTSISGSYRSLVLQTFNFQPASGNQNLFGTLNSDTGTRYVSEIATSSTFTFTGTNFRISQGTSSSTANGFYEVEFPNYANTASWKLMDVRGFSNNNATPTSANTVLWQNLYNQTSAITSIQLFCGAGNFTGGTYFLYGVK